MNQSCTNIIKLNQSPLLLLSILCLALACGPQQKVSEGSIAQGKNQVIPYQLASHPGEDQKVALFLSSSWDSMPVFEQKWARPIWKEGYDILQVSKPKQGDYYRRKSQDYYSNRLGQVFSIFRHLQEKGKLSTDDGLLLITAGESCYLAPELGRQLEPDHTFLINGLPFGPLAQLEKLLSQDSLEESSREWLQQWRIDSLEQLSPTIQKVREGDPGNFVLGDYTNMYWLSYEQSNFTQDYHYLPGKVSWILFEDYPLLHARDIAYIKSLEGMRSSKVGDIRVFPGTGRYKEEQTREGLRAFFKSWVP